MHPGLVRSCLRALAFASACTAPFVSATANESTAVSPYIGQQNRGIKALSAQEIADLQAGKGMGLSKVAELNHVPGPGHAIELADKLALSTQQISEAHTAFDAMAREAKRLGAAIIEKEAALERLFLGPTAIDSEEVHRIISEIAGLQGELRFAHLNAHVVMSRVLSSQQIAAYDRLRGYDGGSDNAIHPHNH